MQSGDPGDVIKNLLVAGLASGLIDGALVPDMDPWSLQPVTRVATSVGEVMDTLGLSQLWTPTLTALNEAVFEKRVADLAVVGTPCAAQAAHKVRTTNHERLNPYRQALRLSIATFCTGVYRPEMVHGLLADKLGVDVQRIKRLEVVPGREELSVHLWDGSTGAIPLDKVEGYTRSGCARCDDYLGESADIAIGTVGARPGYATLIVRSQAGEIALRNALDFGLIEVSDEVDHAALIQASEAKERRQRAQAFDNVMIMMLDALGEPRKRAEVKQAFVRLYEVKKPDRAQREEAGCHVTCGEC
ncbi:MAG TPA: hypothetical protein ENO19_05860 [Halothiobacillaceae bacterium]|nr:hypothetical protein [Halothiobacillaceae bacterium]